MDDLVVFEFLKDKTIPARVRRELKKAFESFDKVQVEKIIDNIVLVKTTNALLSARN